MVYYEELTVIFFLLAYYVSSRYNFKDNARFLMFSGIILMYFMVADYSWWKVFFVLALNIVFYFGYFRWKWGIKSFAMFLVVTFCLNQLLFK